MSGLQQNSDLASWTLCNPVHSLDRVLRIPTDWSQSKTMANFGCFQNVFEANSAPYTERNQIETDANNSISRGEIFFKECGINNHPCEKWSPWRAFHYRWERNDYRTVAKTHQDNEIMNVSRAKLNSCASEFCSSTVRKGDIFRAKSSWKTL